MPRVWRQLREVEVGGVDLSEFDLDISVIKPRDDPLEFDVKVWNLAQDSWDKIDDESKVSITLGWEDGEQEGVIFGEVNNLTRNFDQNDIEFRIQGMDATEEAVTVKPSQATWTQMTWRDEEPQDIVSDIAQSIGLSPDVDNVGAPIQGNYSVTADRKVKDWLDELLEYAAELSGEKWEWFVEQGRLFFVRRNSTRRESPKLTYDGLLLNIDKKEDSDSDVETLEFEAMLDPRIQKGSSVVVDTERFNGTYKVKSYEYDSSDITGDHLVRGDIEATDEVRVVEDNQQTNPPDQFIPF